MKTQIICDHTIMCFDYPESCVLDIGCRRYGFSKPMADLGCEVWAVDPDSNVIAPMEKNIHFIRTAVVGKKDAGKTLELIKWSSGEGNHLSVVNNVGPKNSTRQKTTSHTLHEITVMAGRIWWDIVKLDCEGSEYDILMEWPGPIAGQITVEFHDFTGANPNGEETHRKIRNHLSQWYDIIQHEQTIRYAGKVLNYWDSLFILKGGI